MLRRTLMPARLDHKVSLYGRLVALVVDNECGKTVVVGTISIKAIALLDFLAKRIGMNSPGY